VTRGNHLPDFLWGDNDPSEVIDWTALTTIIPPTTVPGTTIPPTTEPPVTAPMVGVAGVRVAGGLVYKAGLDWLVGRFWAELADGSLSVAPLQPGTCTLEVFDELGAYVGGGIIAGRRDPIDDHHVRFIIKNPGLVPGTNYLARVLLDVVDTSTVGPRTIPMPVN